jgi:hypothetical protein
MMYYNCQLCRRAIKKPYPSKKYCSVGCRENSRKERVEEQELSFWNSVKQVAVLAADHEVLDEATAGSRASSLVQQMGPVGAVGYRVGCRRIGADTNTVHWFPTARQRPSRLFSMNEGPYEIPCPAEYIVAYFDAAGRLIEGSLYKVFLRQRVVGVLWSDGDRRLQLDSSSR